MQEEHIRHPDSGEIIRGKILGTGDVIQEGDVYDSSTGEWVECLPNLPGTTIGLRSHATFIRPEEEERPLDISLSSVKELEDELIRITQDMPKGVCLYFAEGTAPDGMSTSDPDFMAARRVWTALQSHRKKKSFPAL